MGGRTSGCGNNFINAALVMEGACWANVKEAAAFVIVALTFLVHTLVENVLYSIILNCRWCFFCPVVFAQQDHIFTRYFPKTELKGE